MDDQQVGAALRALRRRLGLRQADIGERADVSQDSVSMVERGRLERVSLPTMRRIAVALDATVTVTVRWRGGELYRLLDEEHARLVEAVVARLRAEGWEVAVEYSYNHFGERGSVDVVAWHATRMALLIVEVKVRLLDVQDLHAGVDRKARVVPALLAAERGWRARTVGRLVVVRDTPANRAVVARHAQTFAGRCPRGLARPRGGSGTRWGS